MVPLSTELAPERRARVLALMAIGFAVLLALSWQKWADLAIDGGREMNTPLRLLRGERLYSDVYYLYGPLAPYVNAGLYAAFGTHLNTLYAAGVIASIAVLFLIFDLAAALTGVRAAALTTWTVLVFCVFKQNGNYIFPYTFSAVYGTLLGVAALTAQIHWVRGRHPRAVTLAGVLAGLALICKLEFGFAATASLVAMAWSAPPGERLRTLWRGLWPALAIPLVVYGILLAIVGWDPLVKDTYLLPSYIPPELIYFNRTKLGLGDPARTIRELLSAVAMLGIAASLILAAGARIGAGSVRRVLEMMPTQRRRWLIATAAASIGLLLVNRWMFGTRWDISPFRALPVLCAGLVGTSLWGRPGAGDDDTQRRSLLVVGVYALAVLARVILRVPSGGAYGAYLLPVPLLVFTHLGTTFHRRILSVSPVSAASASRVVIAFFTIGLTAATIVVGYRYIRSDHGALRTARGTTKMSLAESHAYSGALDFIAHATRPGEYISAVPEGSSLNFLAERPAPLRYEILTPGFLDAAGEQRAIEQLEARHVRFVFLLNRPTTEFGCHAFGRDCYRNLMAWIDAHYRADSAFGDGASTASEIGDPRFFIKVYGRTAAWAESATASAR